MSCLKCFPLQLWSSMILSMWAFTAFLYSSLLTKRLSRRTAEPNLSSFRTKEMMTFLRRCLQA